MEELSPDRRARMIRTFEAQGMMKTLGVTIEKVNPGFVQFWLPFNTSFSQQHGFMHAGAITTALDSACGFAALTLMPDDAEVLTVELKVSLLAPAHGERFLVRGWTIKSGRTLTFTHGSAYADRDGEAIQVATISATMMAVRDHPDIRLAATSNPNG